MYLQFRPVFQVILSTLALVGLLSAANCGSSGGSGGEATVVNVDEHDFVITPGSTSAPAGRVTFHVSNSSLEVHEFLVVKTDLAPDALPTANFKYVENGPGTEVIDELSEIPPGTSKDLVIDLPAGSYVLLCNIMAFHYQLGMHAAFTVN